MYILLEGGEGTGKSTHAKKLAAALVDLGYDVLLTKEPGSPHSPICASIRELLLNPAHTLADRAALFLFLADRAQHIEQVTKALALGKVVISDRGTISTYVYHTALERDRVLPEDAELCKMLDYAQQIKPDLCYIFSSSLEWCYSQLALRGKLDRIESFSTEFHARTHTLFQEGNVRALCNLMQFSPKKLSWVPATSGHTEAEINAFLVNSTIKELEGE